MIGPAARSRGRARVETQRTVARGYVEMALSYTGEPPRTDTAPKDERYPPPGSFFTLLPSAYPAPMLRRPFAYSDAGDSGFSFIYEIRGKATRDFSKLKSGDAVDWIGPLGTGFPDPPEGSRPVLVAGGIGVGPILYLSRRLAQRGIQAVVSLGARTADLVPDIEWPEGTDLRICTEDGSSGMRGNALDGIAAGVPRDAVFYSCGPRPMMAALHEKASASGSPCWVSLEEIMACGVGACKGCVVEAVDLSAAPAYKCACTDGPVFDSGKIVW
jgi:dihydroorotate dehydrogenase electron transfer subunit